MKMSAKALSPRHHIGFVQEGKEKSGGPGLPRLQVQPPDQIAVGGVADHEVPLAVIAKSKAAIETLRPLIVLPHAEIDRMRPASARPGNGVNDQGVGNARALDALIDI